MLLKQTILFTNVLKAKELITFQINKAPKGGKVSKSYLLNLPLKWYKDESQRYTEHDSE